MRPHTTIAGRSRRRALCALALGVGAAVLALLFGLPGLGVASRANGQGSVEEPTPHTDASIPAKDVTLFGSSPKEAAGETWGIGSLEGASVLVRYTAAANGHASQWTLGGALLDVEGKPLKSFELDKPENGTQHDPSPLAGDITEAGSGVLAGTVEPEKQDVLLVRNPGGSFQQTTALPHEGELALQSHESLLGANRVPLIAALEETTSGKDHAGALVVPVNEAEDEETRVLHWDGEHWSSEPIEVPSGASKGFEVLAIGASSPTNAWLLARMQLTAGDPAESVALFRRKPVSGSETKETWQPVATTAGGAAGEPLTAEGIPFTVPKDDQSQVLTVTGEGVWVDGERTDLRSTTTLFFKPEGEAGGKVLGTWCTEKCAHELPEALPSEHERSFAWANSSISDGFGERVITGFDDGVSLRLEGTEFKRVLALGGTGFSGQENGTVGSDLGAAFSSPREGWLGAAELPVHLTTESIASRLKPWPVPFKDALLAVAPEPNEPVGALSSEALAVGDHGEVARYEPGKGWQPESLLGQAGRRETTRLRAVAWPTSNLAYAVGNSETAGTPTPAMWLWRGETGLWEPDPATPANFRGNLLAIAFDPSEPDRGYAVGEDGVLLSYGKTWTQETVPAAVTGASFTSVAFAGSEAIVAYRKLISPSRNAYEGGLLVNAGNGGGWEIDQSAATALGTRVPLAVAGLADGGAAFTAAEGGGAKQLYERQGPGAAWTQASAVPPGAGLGSIALFRENGELRAILTAGSLGETYGVEKEATPPAGFPPTLLAPYPLASSQGTPTPILRQTESGWSDESHELTEFIEPLGEYKRFDTPYEPDPIAAVLVGPSGEQGWAVGGVVDEHFSRMDTSDVWRYPSEGTTPTGVGSASVTATGGMTFAIGGDAQCAAPCADLAKANIGPDAWLSSALDSAAEIAGVKAFIYTGPRVTTGETAGPATLAVPRKRELARYAELLSASRLPTFAAASKTDIDEAGSETTFEADIGAKYPFGPSSSELQLLRGPTNGKSGGYYAIEAQNPGASGDELVRVIVLDDHTGEVETEQLQWLVEELKTAGAHKPEPEPAIVVGNDDLATQIANGGEEAEAAKRVADALVEYHASAYFFSDPEANVRGVLTAPNGSSGSVPTYGSGSLGYIETRLRPELAFLGASGFLLATVEPLAAKAATNQANVKVALIPSVGELSMEAEEGTLLRRSEAAEFVGLARRPRSGNLANRQSQELESSPYIPIPSHCREAACEQEIEPEYSFSSSNPKVGEFVQPNEASAELHAVLLGTNGDPIPDPKSGLFCAYNPGTTTVTLTAGTMSYSLPVTVEPGSVRRPCGTVPAATLAELPTSAPVPTPTPSPTPAGTTPTSSALPLAIPPVPAPLTPPAPRPAPPAAPPSFFVTPTVAAFVPAFVPLPVPTPARPTPPSGTSPVTSPVEAPEREEEHEAAPDSVSNQAMAYSAPEHEPEPAYIIGIVVLAAFAGASMRGRSGRRRRKLEVAPATISAIRTQRRNTGPPGPRR